MNNQTENARTKLADPDAKTALIKTFQQPIGSLRHDWDVIVDQCDKQQRVTVKLVNFLQILECRHLMTWERASNKKLEAPHCVLRACAQSHTDFKPQSTIRIHYQITHKETC